jgi:hypothetical protein
MPDDAFESLEKSLHAVLRAQPGRRAPATLEQRVRAEIARRAALPWWRCPFARWPGAARGAFLALSGGAALMCIAAAVTFFDGPGAELAGRGLHAFAGARAMVRSVAMPLADVVRGIPPGWIYLSAGALAAAYGALFGLGTAAYRLLWKAR